MKSFLRQKSVLLDIWVTKAANHILTYRYSCFMVALSNWCRSCETAQACLCSRRKNTFQRNKDIKCNGLFFIRAEKTSFLCQKRILGFSIHSLRKSAFSKFFSFRGFRILSEEVGYTDIVPVVLLNKILGVAFTIACIVCCIYNYPYIIPPSCAFNSVIIPELSAVCFSKRSCIVTRHSTWVLTTCHRSSTSGVTRHHEGMQFTP